MSNENCNSVSNSYGCSSCYGCRNSYGCRYSYASKFLLFCNKVECSKYKIFNKQVLKERYEEVMSAYRDFDWYPKQTNAFDLYMKAGNDWKKVDPMEIEYNEWEESWKDIPKDMLTWIQSLEEFDAEILKEITGIDVEVSESAIIIDGKEYSESTIKKALKEYVK